MKLCVKPNEKITVTKVGRDQIHVVHHLSKVVGDAWGDCAYDNGLHIQTSGSVSYKAVHIKIAQFTQTQTVHSYSLPLMKV